MPRSPKPTTTHLQNFRVEFTNHEYLLARAKRSGSPWVEAFNHELLFLRNGAIPTPLFRRIDSFAKNKRSTFRDEMKMIMWNAAMQLPVAVPGHASPAPRATHQTSANITGPNHAYLLNRAVTTGREMSAVINSELLFARSFELTPELVARVEKHCVERSITVRDWSQLELIRAAWQLPEADPPKKIGRRESPY